MNLERFIIFLAAFFFLLYGLAFAFLPAAMAMVVTGSEPEGISALIDFRATYGGLNIAVGLVLFYLFTIKQRRACLVVIIVLLLSMAVTRTIGLLTEGSGNLFMYLFLVLEILGAALAAIAMKGQAHAIE
ncbi:MAG: DUF4345 family protein [Pseudomonadota bacterium]